MRILKAVLFLVVRMSLLYADFSYAIGNSCLSCHSNLKNDGEN